MSTDGGLQRQFFEMLMDSQWWSADQLRNYQRSQLRQLLRHAKKNAPFYEDRLDAVVKPNGDIDWDRWSEIPIVKRSDMIEHREAMQARELPAGHGPTAVLETSGSTGLPIKMTVTGISTLANNGLRWRVQRWHSLDWAKVVCSSLGDAQHAVDWPYGEPLGTWGPAWDERSKLGGAWTISRTLPSEFLFRFLQEHHCSYLNAGPNMAHINALDAQRLDIRIQIDAILVQGNVVRQADRDICRKVFGAELIEHYSSKEAGHMAHPCPLGVLHINMESCLIEVLDENDEQVAPGGRGRVVVTPLFETAQPLIRYEQGDWATSGKPCRCGRHGSTIERLHGRAIAIFRHPSGQAVANLMPDSTTGALDAHYWQLAQVGPNDYELRYVPRDPNGYGDEKSVIDTFRKTFFVDAGLRFVRLSEIPPTSGGKLVEYVNEWNAGIT